MQVIGSGFGRTGTLSTKAALETLGFGPCYHMQEVLVRPSHIRVWLDRAEGRPVDWVALFDGWGSCVDFPASVVWEELLAAFPDAKVLHTVRDADRWYESTAETIYRTTEFVTPWMRRGVPLLGRAFRMVDLLIWDGLFDGRFEDRAAALETYRTWTERVATTVPADRLLVFDVSEGWGPLCAFLSVPMPDVPFPQVNDRAQMKRRLIALRVVSAGVPVLAGAGLAVLLGRASRRMFNRRRPG